MLSGYSAPLNQVIKYEKVKFSTGLDGKRGRYLGFSKEADDAWNELQESESLLSISSGDSGGPKARLTPIVKISRDCKPVSRGAEGDGGRVYPRKRKERLHHICCEYVA
jgi:hypothetical protein